MNVRHNRDQAQQTAGLSKRIAQIDAKATRDALYVQGYALTGQILNAAECEKLRADYGEESLYRSRIHLARHGFGRGEYKYYVAPLAAFIAGLRQQFYRILAPIANAWACDLKTGQTFPPEHNDFLRHCHELGQTKPTPLILKYGARDYNCLHQDLYGEAVFPFQLAFLLSRPGQDFSGGEFILTEQRPRMQSRAEVVPLAQGEGVIFPVHNRPVQGQRGTYKTAMRHGVSMVRSGERFTLGIIFHDAK